LVKMFGFVGCVYSWLVASLEGGYGGDAGGGGRVLAVR